MKRMLALVLALMLCGLAAAETRERTIYLEGEPETIVEVRFISDSGISFWYDAEAMDIAEVYGGAEIHVYPKDMGDSGTVLLSLIPSAYAGETPWKWLELNAQPGVEYNEDVTESGDPIRWFSVVSPYNQAKLWSYYAVEGASDFAVAEGLWPMEADEGWGKRLRAVLQTIEFGVDGSETDAPVSAQWLADAGIDPDDGEVFQADAGDEAVGVAFAASTPVRSFELVALTFEGFDGDGVRFGAEPLAAWPELAPGQPLAVSMSFFGDIPGYGVRYADPETGEPRLYAVEISGEDGSLRLTPIEAADIEPAED